jgi:hypothetical protein
MRHRRGAAAEEKRTGADMLFHVTVNTNSKSFSKGVLIQAKRSRASGRIDEYERLKEQCDDMLNITPAAFVFDYGPNEVRCGSALKIAGSTGPNLRRECIWTSYRFFLEFFRCPVGDRAITSARFDDLVVNLRAITFGGEKASELRHSQSVPQLLDLRLPSGAVKGSTSRNHQFPLSEVIGEVFLSFSTQVAKSDDNFDGFICVLQMEVFGIQIAKIGGDSLRLPKEYV